MGWYSKNNPPGRIVKQDKGSQEEPLSYSEKRDLLLYKYNNILKEYWIKMGHKRFNISEAKKTIIVQEKEIKTLKKKLIQLQFNFDKLDEDFKKLHDSPTIVEKIVEKIVIKQDTEIQQKQLIKCKYLKDSTKVKDRHTKRIIQELYKDKTLFDNHLDKLLWRVEFMAEAIGVTVRTIYKWEEKYNWNILKAGAINMINFNNYLEEYVYEYK